MKKTSIHFEPCNVLKSEQHNERKQQLDYIFPELTRNNESLCYVQNLEQRERECRELYQTKVGQKMQKKTVPIREGVVVIDENTTMEQLEILANEIRLELGWQPLQIHIHRDEGYMKSPDNKGGHEVAKLNLHAHLIFDCQNKETGRMHRNNKNQFSRVQTITAQTLGMERGQSSSRRHVKSLDYKIQQKKADLERLNRQILNFEELAKETIEELEKLEKLRDYSLKKAESILEEMREENQSRRRGRRM